MSSAYRRYATYHRRQAQTVSSLRDARIHEYLTHHTAPIGLYGVNCTACVAPLRGELYLSDRFGAALLQSAFNRESLHIQHAFTRFEMRQISFI